VLGEVLTPTPAPATPAALPASGGGGVTSSTGDWHPFALLIGSMVLMVAGVGSASWALTRRIR
jgi:hypothetical protein